MWPKDAPTMSHDNFGWNRQMGAFRGFSFAKYDDAIKINFKSD